MKTIKTKNNKIIKVSDQDFKLISKYSWWVENRYGCWRAFAFKEGKAIAMHRLIKGFPKGLVVDHINHDTLDNRRCNLRVCTQAENSRNRLVSKNSKSGIKGVWWFKLTKKWMAAIQINKKKKYIGYFKTKEEAINAYNKAAKKYHGRFAHLSR